MRTALAVFLAAALFSCAPARRARVADPEPGVFAELSAEVDKLPSSPEKTNIERLLGRIEPRVRAGGLVLGSGLNLSEMEGLALLGDTLAPVAIEIGFATDAKDWSGDGVADGIELHLIPRDSTGSAVKIPGRVETVLFRISGLGFNLPGSALDKWTVSGDTLRYAWNESLFPAYIVRMPWTEGLPDVFEAVLSVTFRPVYGQPLSARKQIAITAAPPVPPQPPTPPAPEAVAPAVPAPAEPAAAPPASQPAAEP